MDPSFKDSEVIINLNLLKRTRFYSIIDPNGKKIFGYHTGRLIFAMIFVINYALVAFSNLGLFVNVDYKLSSSEYFIIFSTDLANCLNFYRICLLFYRVDKVADLLEVTRVDFLTSELCRKNNNILNGYRNTIKKFTNLYVILVVVVGTQWVVYAFLNSVFFVADENSNKRIPNILNMPFPVNARVYNQYYILFFAIETIFPFFLLYCSVMIDLFLLSFASIITCQYEVLNLSTKDLGHENKRPAENDNSRVDFNNDLIRILFDQRNLFLQFKTFNEVARPILLALIALNSTCIIILTFMTILIYSSPELFSIDYLVKIGSGVSFLCLQFYLYSLLFENLSRERESVNIGIYSSNWTNMELKSKKLLLLAMQMNDANLVQMRASPKRIINLQQFSSVMITCYNTISVLVKTMGKKK